MVRFRKALSVLFFILFSTGLNAQVIRPYLQTPTDTSVWITWKTDSGTESKVIYGLDSTQLTGWDTGHCRVLSDADYDNNYFYHSVQITNLIPGQAYYYRIITGDLQSGIYRFYTQPSIDTRTGVYRFLIFGDHQVKTDDRYERLLIAAREKVIEKFGGQVEDHINLIINDGDQVDQGILDQYEFVHFKPSSVLSGNIPFMTTMGNHEMYGSPGVSLYYDHYYYDEIGYKGIISPGGENYYSYQQKNIVFIHLSSEHTTDAQVAWVQQIVDSAKADPFVDWIISIGHRPIQAEQFVGDISVFIRDRIIPVLVQTEKSALFIGGHHHLYARGQVRDYPMYHIISGGGSWDQYWGQSTEKDYDDVQKTIDFWTYQIVTIDGDKKEMMVESYAIGSPKLGFAFDNILIDSFYRKLPDSPPMKPSITSIPDDSVTLPFTFISSPYATGSQEPYNSVQFQAFSDDDRATPVVDLIRDYENLYGTTGDPTYLPVDIHKGVDIFQYTIKKNTLPDGSYHIYVRHRDRNISWSEWSDPVEFKVKGSTGGFVSISTDKTLFSPNENIPVNYEFGPGNEKDWIGIYKNGDIPGNEPSTDWKYVDGSSGTVNLQVSQSGQYFIAFFENDGYTELTERITVYIASTPLLSTNKAGFNEGEEIQVSYSSAPGLPDDWIGIYKSTDTPGMVASTLWDYTSGTSGTVTFAGLPSGYYFVNYFLLDGYMEAGERIIFSVGSDLAVVFSDKFNYQKGETITIGFENGPGTAADWIGILHQNAPPGIAPLVDRQYVQNLYSGDIAFNLSLDPGQYYAAMFINNSNIRISNKAGFMVEPETSVSDIPSGFPYIDIFPSPSSDHLTIIAGGLTPGDAELSISSMNGQTVFRTQTEIVCPDYYSEINIPYADPGLYVVSLKSSQQILVKKFVVE
jgi:hypothetical protein